MRTQTPLGRLREIRDQQGPEPTDGERDWLIQKAAGQSSVRQIALAAGLSPTRVHEIVGPQA